MSTNMIVNSLGTRLWELMKRSGAVWEYSYKGNLRAPHVVLRSGKHSNGFVDTLQYLSRVANLSAAAEMLARKLAGGLDGIRPDWIFGSPMAGIPFATEVARSWEINRIGFNEKVGDKELICRFDLSPGEKFLIVEEMTTTGGTPQRGIDAVLKKNPTAVALPIVAAFLTRCGHRPTELQGRELISLVSLPELNVEYSEWEPDNCPLCSSGSTPISNCKRVWSDLLKTMMDDPPTSLFDTRPFS